MRDEALIYSFPPVARDDAKALILGSMPGVASLDAQQYYAHPRNAFWPIMGALFDAGLDKPYEARLEILKAHKIALWDVLQCCVRKNSEDAAIKNEVPQDFKSFFAAHPKITHVYFNGSKAAQVFKRFMRGCPSHMVFATLPSTSPAHAAMRFEEKCAQWMTISAHL